MGTSALKPTAAIGLMAASLLVGCSQLQTSTGASGSAAEPQARLVASGFGQDGKYVQGIAVVTPDNPAAVDHFVTASVNFKDAAGKIVSTQEQVESFSWPGQELVLPVWLDLNSSPPNTKITAIDVSVSAGNSVGGKGDLKPLPVLNADEIRPGQFGGYTAAFTFTNDADQDLQNLRVGVVCYDAAGTIIGGGSAYPDLAPAGKSIRIEPSTLTVAAQPASCRAFPNYGY